MFLSVFELFRIGIGPSSSHTVGPMRAMARFLSALRAGPGIGSVYRVEVRLYGSLAYTGRGHASDVAVVLGLLGQTPEGVDPDHVPALVDGARIGATLELGGEHGIGFDAEGDVVFDPGPPLAAHPNGIRARAYDASGALMLERVYFSIGGGFVVGEEELAEDAVAGQRPDVPYPFATAAEMLSMGRESGRSVASMKRANEIAHHGEAELDHGLRQIWGAMNACIDRGLLAGGVLPGGLEVRRRAASIRARLEVEREGNLRYDHTVMDWLGLYAIAVNEENASGGRVVTAPTNGAAGVVPATIRYYLDFCPGAAVDRVGEFLLTAAAVGGIVKSNASISGAEVGCQGEVGTASAMAAAGLAAVLGATNEQIENAAEIAIEHHLGMTCDPVAGLVQVPCIERNAMGAVKAVAAASLALKGDGNHFVPLDAAVETLRRTGADMRSDYKETSRGGLAIAVSFPAC